MTHESNQDESQKDLCITSEQLTETWKNGNLPAGDYWCEIIESPYIEKVYLTKGEDFVVKILAPVPSYEEWQEYKNANDSMFDTIKMLNKDNYKLEKENAKLKDLLKECHDTIYETAFKLRKVSEIDKCNEIRKKIREVFGAEYGFKTPKYYVRNRAKDLGEE